jgi:hypothetical protein
VGPDTGLSARVRSLPREPDAEAHWSAGSGPAAETIPLDARSSGAPSGWTDARSSGAPSGWLFVDREKAASSASPTARRGEAQGLLGVLRERRLLAQPHHQHVQLASVYDPGTGAGYPRNL